MQRSHRHNALQSPLALGALGLFFWACGGSHGARLSQAIEAPEALSAAALENASPTQALAQPPCDVLSACIDTSPCSETICLDGWCRALPAEDPDCCVSGVSLAYPFDPEEAHALPLAEPDTGEAWVLSGERALSPPTSLHFGDPNNGRMNGFEPVKGSFEFPAMRIPPSAGANLRFWIYADIEADASRDDLSLVVHALPPNGDTLPPIRIMNKGAMPSTIYGGFAEVSVPLDDFAGYTIRLALYFDSIVAPNAARQGIFIDDLELELSCAERNDAGATSSGGSVSPTEGASGTGLKEDLLTGSADGAQQASGGEPDALRTGDAPSGSDDAPSGAGDAPSGSDDSPPGTDDAPSGSGDSPSGADDAPSESGDVPSGSGDAPSGTEPPSSSGSFQSGGSTSDPCAASDAHDNCCTSDAECDDGNPATQNVCEGAECVATWAPNACQSDAECADAESCTLDRCEQGECVFEGVFGQACCVPASQSIASFDAESLEGLFVTDNLETGAFWRPDPTRSTSGAFSLYCGDPVTQSFGVGQRVKSSATTPVLEIAPGGQTRLDFDLFMSTRPSAQLDIFQVLMLREGVLTPLWSSKVFATGNTMGFVPVSIDLSHYAGQSLQLRFVFDSVDGHAPQLEGTYIDSIRLETTCD